MNKIKILSISAILLMLFSTNCLAKTNELKVYKLNETIPINQVEDYKAEINQELEIDGVKYKIENIEEKQNITKKSQKQTIEEQKIVKTDDKYEILKMFEDKKEYEKDGYKGVLELEHNNLEIEINDSYMEQYKVTLEKEYKNVKSNELMNIPKTIIEDGVTYYLTNPIWNIYKIEKIEGNDVPIAYSGNMIYEGIKERTIVTSYIATAKYKGTLSKEEVESVTFNITYKEIPEETNYMPIAVTTGTGIIIVSGILIMRRKNVYIYNSQDEKWKLVKKLYISKNQKVINITPLKSFSNKYKIVLDNKIFTKLQDENITIKYFDKSYIYQIKDKEFEIVM